MFAKNNKNVMTKSLIPPNFSSCFESFLSAEPFRAQTFWVVQFMPCFSGATVGTPGNRDVSPKLPLVDLQHPGRILAWGNPSCQAVPATINLCSLYSESVDPGLKDKIQVVILHTMSLTACVSIDLCLIKITDLTQRVSAIMLESFFSQLLPES